MEAAHPVALPEPVTGSRMRLLHLIVALGHSNAQYNEHCLPLRNERNISICSFSSAAVDVPPELMVFEGDGTVRGFAAALRRALDEGPYDIVHAHAPGTAAMLLLANAMRRWPMSNGVLTIHNSRRSFSLRNQLILAPLFVAFPTVVFCSHAACASFPRGMRALANTVEVVQNGVDTVRIDRALEGARGDGATFRVASVGRLIPRKDPATLVDAFKLSSDSPDDELLFVGDGRERAHVIERAERSGLGPRVTVTGLVERDEVYRRLATSSLFVSTSRGEGLPVSVLEAMTCGRPVLISDIPSHREIAAAGDCVPLVAPGDVDGFATEIQRFKAMSRDERAATGRRCRELVKDRFSLEAMHRSYERVYRGALRRATAGLRRKEGMR